MSSVQESPYPRLPPQEIVNNEYQLAQKIDLNAYQSATELRQEVKKLDLQGIQRYQVHRVSHRDSPTSIVGEQSFNEASKITTAKLQKFPGQQEFELSPDAEPILEIEH